MFLIFRDRFGCCNVFFVLIIITPVYTTTQQHHRFEFDVFFVVDKKVTRRDGKAAYIMVC